MPIISVVNLKGGTGKTTSCCNLFRAFERSKVKTLLIDLDNQQSIVNVNTILNLGWNVITKIDSEEINKHSVTLIDTKPDFNTKTVEAIKLADLVLMPCRPSAVDVLSTLKAIEAIRNIDSDKSLFVFLNATIANSTYNNEVKDLFKAQNVDVLESEISLLVDFSRSLLQSGSIYETNNKKGQQQFDALCLEIYGKLIN